MRRTILTANLAAFYDFVDSNFLNNKRPPVPGGAWPTESLRNKSLADLQQIWFSLVKERNMLATTKEHYLKHQEELGAMPAPSRLKMVEESMANIRSVVRERDDIAVRHAAAIFRERLAKGQYRYPPGPPMPPGHHDKDGTSAVRLTLSRRVGESRLRELLGRFDVFASHKGIVSVTLRLPDAVLVRKESAEGAWRQYQADRSDAAEYAKWADMGPSVMDHTAVELAPGVFAAAGADAEAEANGNNSGDDGDLVVAAMLPVPPPKLAPPPPASPLERMKLHRRSALSKSIIQLGYFPNITLEPPRYASAAAVPRPVHPDEIEGPWEAVVVYAGADGLEYARSLGLSAIDGAAVVSVDAEDRAPVPASAVDPAYQEAVSEEAAAEATMMAWPHVPEWKYEYDVYTKKHVADIVQFNYSNVVDYVDREVLLTGKSVWECPIDIDPTCGGMKSIPPHARRPKRVMSPGIGEIGVTDI